MIVRDCKAGAEKTLNWHIIWLLWRVGGVGGESSIIVEFLPPKAGDEALGRAMLVRTAHLFNSGWCIVVKACLRKISRLKPWQRGG